MNKADLSGSNLAGSNLSGADLTDAILSEVNLSGVDLSDAKLTPIQVKAAREETWKKAKYGKKFLFENPEFCEELGLLLETVS